MEQSAATTPPRPATAKAPASEPVSSTSPMLGHSTTELVAPGVLPDRYKTQLCRHFMELGKCLYGDKCAFAHGKWELRTVDRNRAVGRAQRPRGSLTVSLPESRRESNTTDWGGLTRTNSNVQPTSEVNTPLPAGAAPWPPRASFQLGETPPQAPAATPPGGCPAKSSPFAVGAVGTPTAAPSAAPARESDARRRRSSLDFAPGHHDHNKSGAFSAADLSASTDSGCAAVGDHAHTAGTGVPSTPNNPAHRHGPNFKHQPYRATPRSAPLTPL